ncbi:MAG: hypothetical protein KIT22_07350 [Verrucomicrobiae bacterium]|nr:hypothetical protein [Verrucomicrobiae bacterium]
MKHSTSRDFIPAVERVGMGSLVERHAAEQQEIRQRALLDTLQRAEAPRDFDGPPPARSFEEGLIVVIATYDDGKPLLDPSARINTIHHLLLALEHQRSALPDKARDNFKIIISDNGLNDDQRSRLKDYLANLSTQARAKARTKPEWMIVDAPKERGNSYTRTAGFARNRALREIWRRKRTDRSFRAPVLIHDDDAVTDGIGEMYKLLSRHRNVIGAVAPCVDKVRDVGRHAIHVRTQTYERRRGTPAQCSSFPSLFDSDGLINFNVLFAFGSSRIPKTCSLLLHPEAIDDLTSNNGDVFHVWKRGSFEDMCLSIGLACSNWDVFECKSSRAYDQVRGHPGAALRQQFSWAYDHATAFYDFSVISKLLPTSVVYPGVSVLVPLAKEERSALGGWGLQRLRRLRGFSGLQATIARPEEVRETLRYIREQMSTKRQALAFRRKHRYAFEGGFGTVKDLLATVRVTLGVVDQVLKQLDPDKFERIEVPFIDRKLVYSTWGERGDYSEALRYERDLRVARLLGNLGSMYRNSTNDFARGVVRCVALGPRQAT